MMKKSTFCLVNVLFFVTYWNKSISNKWQRGVQVLCLLLNMESKTKHSTVFYLISYLHVESKHGLCVSLLFVQYRYIPICNTKKYIYKTSKIEKVPRGIQGEKSSKDIASSRNTYKTNTFYFIILELIPMFRLASEGHVCLGHLNSTAFNKAQVVQLVELQTSALRVVGSNSTLGKNFSFCILSLSTRFWQVDWSNTNEIKHDVHPRYIGA